MKIADRWWERKSFSDGITQLWEPHVHSLVRCNVWHVRGRDRDLVVDTGIGVASLSKAIEDLADKPVIGLATHIHWDPVGSLHEFDQRVMHRAEANQMKPYRGFNTLMRSDFEQAFRDCDVIAAPTSPEPAFRLGEKADDPLAMYLEDIYTVSANLAGIPGISIPCGMADHLPIGFQLLGPALAEAELLRAADAFQRISEHHLLTPPDMTGM